VEGPARLLVVCTGNVARSPILVAMLESLIESEGRNWVVHSAGTLAGEGDRVSARTLAALAGLAAVDAPFLTLHRSHRLNPVDVAWADAVLTVEADQVRFIRATFPGAEPKTVSVGQLVDEAPADLALVERVTAIARRDPDARFDVADPAGGDQADYDAATARLWEIAQRLVLATGA
jgi:protein-tyrosine-phosphatase